MEEHFTAIAISIAGPALLGVFGFLWKTNSRLSTIERELKAHEHRINHNSSTLSKHFDKAFTIRKNVPDR